MALTETIGALLLAHGPALLLVACAIAAFGLPAPATLGLLIAGGFAARGQLPWTPTIAAGIVGTVVGDHLAYLLAAKASDRVHRWRVARHLARAEAMVGRWGMAGIFVSRWLVPTVLTPAVNYFAGLSRYPLVRFTPAVIAGEAVYVIGYMALGAAFDSQIEHAYRLVGRTSLLVLLAIVAVASLMAWRRRRR